LDLSKREYLKKTIKKAIMSLEDSLKGANFDSKKWLEE